MFSHEKLTVYQSSVQWLTLSTQISGALPTGNGELANQLKRATLSVPLNIAEGAGKISRLDKQRFFAIARGSALECAAILDALLVLDLVQTKTISAGKGILYEIVCMLSVMCKR